MHVGGYPWWIGSGWVMAMDDDDDDDDDGNDGNDDEWNVYILIHPRVVTTRDRVVAVVAVRTHHPHRRSRYAYRDDHSRRTEANKADATPTAATDLDTLAENSCMFARAADTLTLEL